MSTLGGLTVDATPCLMCRTDYVGEDQLTPEPRPTTIGGSRGEVVTRHGGGPFGEVGGLHRMRRGSRTRQRSFSALATCALVTGLGGLMAPVPAGAAMAPNQAWTQMINFNWSPSGGDPDCSHNVPGNGPCIAWPRGAQSLQWTMGGNGWTGGVSWHDEVASAISDIDNLPYDSPRFYTEANPCNLCISVEDLGAGICANTTATATGSTITHVDLKINSNSNETWAISWANTDIYHQPRCDFRVMIRHELIHALGEGHSSQSADLMYWQEVYRQTPESVDSDARAGLNVLYGPLPNGGSACSPVDLTIGVKLDARCQ